MTRQTLPAGDLRLLCRLARREDAVRIAEVRLAAFEALHSDRLDEPMSDDRRSVITTLGLSAGSGQTAVCTRASRVIGAVTLLLPNQPASEAWRIDGAGLRLLAIEPAEQRRGAATRLIREVEQLARSCGARSMCLRIRRELEHLRNLYERLGYRHDCLGDVVLPSGVALVGLLKELSVHVEES